MLGANRIIRGGFLISHLEKIPIKFSMKIEINFEFSNSKFLFNVPDPKFFVIIDFINFQKEREHIIFFSPPWGICPKMKIIS
jgi:hypothetical protein